MDSLLLLIPISLFLGLLGLVGFLWALRTRQYEDLDGAAARILFDDQPRKETPK
jgi:cbb3-type cytochrome oxidase maturation protein